MGTTIQYQMKQAQFKRYTPICDNCTHRQISSDPRADRTERTCMKHGFFVMKSSSCKDHLPKRTGR